MGGWGEHYPIFWGFFNLFNFAKPLNHSYVSPEMDRLEYTELSGGFEHYTISDSETIERFEKCRWVRTQRDRVKI